MPIEVIEGVVAIATIISCMVIITYQICREVNQNP